MSERRGKWLALIAIAILALNLRTAVGSLSPIISFIQGEIPLPVATIGLLGIAAPLAFAMATPLANQPARKIGVERTLLATVLMIIFGHIMRAVSPDSSWLFAGSLLSLLGMGIGNVLLPVMVRKYFPKRVGLISTIYITLTATSATLGALVAVPVAEEFGWRFALGQWAIFATLVILPLVLLWGNSTPEKKLAATGNAKIWRSPTAWSLAGMQSVTSVFGYVSFAWMPLMLVEYNRISVAEGGLMLALFALMGLPSSLAAPILAQRFPSSHVWIVVFSGVTGLSGVLGILFGGTSLLWFWIIIYGLGPSMFPLALTLFNLRSETRSTVLSVSSFGQGLSYTSASISVLVVGLLRELTGDWVAPLWYIFCFGLISIPVAYQISKKRTIDSELKPA